MDRVQQLGNRHSPTQHGLPEVYAAGEWMKESMITAQIKAYLSSVPNLFFWKTHGGLYGTAGMPDLIICYKGKFIALECKAPGRKPTLVQKLTINKINRAGGLAVVVHSLEEAKEILRRFD